MGIERERGRERERERERERDTLKYVCGYRKYNYAFVRGSLLQK